MYSLHHRPAPRPFSRHSPQIYSDDSRQLGQQCVHFNGRNIPISTKKFRAPDPRERTSAGGTAGHRRVLIQLDWQRASIVSEVSLDLSAESGPEEEVEISTRVTKNNSCENSATDQRDNIESADAIRGEQQSCLPTKPTPILLKNAVGTHPPPPPASLFSPKSQRKIELNREMDVMNKRTNGVGENTRENLLDAIRRMGGVQGLRRSKDGNGEQ